MKKLPLFFLLIVTAPLAAQNLRPDVLSGGGEALAAASGGGRLAFTIGETAIQTLAVPNGNVVCAQGFHSGAIGASSPIPPARAVAPPPRNKQAYLSKPSDLAGWGVNVYPNPVTQILVIDYSATDANIALDISLWDGQGRMVVDASRLLDGTTKHLDIQHLQTGLYLLCARRPDGQVSMTRILKAE